MKVSSEAPSTDARPLSTGPIKLPEGLVGFPDHHVCEIVAIPDQLPFLWLRISGPDTIDFVVIEPGGWIADYEPELFDEDAAILDIKDPNEAMVLNIVTVRPGATATATANLAGPVVINRRTGVGKQCILANYARYTAHYPLVDNQAAAGGHN